MFAWGGRLLVRWRWFVLAAAAGVMLFGATWGTGVFPYLTGGGFVDPASESSRAAERIRAELGDQDTHLIVLYRSDTETVDAPTFAEAVTDRAAALRASPAVISVVSWYDTGAPHLVATDRHATYLAVKLAGEDEDELVDSYHQIRELTPAAGVTTEVGGWVAFLDDANQQTERDVVRAEVVSFPLLLVLLILIFRGVVAALAPLLIGGLAILGAFITTLILAQLSEVSVFAVNTITVIGLAMAIDYALFIVSRFREELDRGRAVDEAIRHTLATAGRTVFVSGLTIMLALASLLIFPQSFLRSMALGGISAVGVAMLGSLTVLPATLAVLGHRINAGRVRLPFRRRANQHDDHEGAWARLARSVMRRPVVYLLAVIAVLALLTVPAARMQFGGFDERVLPADAPSRVVAERIAADFPGDGVDPIAVLVSGASPAVAADFAAQIEALPFVESATVTAAQGQSALIAVQYPGSPTSDVAQDAVRAIRDLPAPAGAEVLVGGRTATDVDLLDGLRSGLPWMALLMATAIMVLLFFAFGSVVLPVKAVAMNLVSIGAAVGVVVWGFQDGHLADLLGFTATGFIQPAMVLLMLAVLFGLSTDYEVFLLSRVREEWDRGRDNTSSVAAGLQRTGRIITAAALLLIVVVAGFATGEMAYVKLLGVGMIVSIAVDATLVRALLVPATMRLLGHWNWWAPGPLGRLYRRYGISDADGRLEPVSATVSLHR